MIKFNLSNAILNKKLIPIYVFLIISVGLFYLMGYQRAAAKGPFSRHSYRQSGSYAFALNYYYENIRFLEPSVLCIIKDKEKKQLANFPDYILPHREY